MNPQPGVSFQDGPDCPEMVVVPAGSFKMGSPSDEPGRRDNEDPMHEVRIEAPFAIGVYTVTFAEWDACVQNFGCWVSPHDQRWGRGRRPVIGVNWRDAKTYVAWLSEKTNRPYRLLSESEWEYAARAGTGTAYSWGNQAAKKWANYDLPSHESKMTKPVGSFEPNAWGLYDMHGNVWEWVEDCWNNNYEGAPTDGSAWLSGDCHRHVLRGGSWLDADPSHLRAAYRVRMSTDQRDFDCGFRVAHTLAS